MMPMNSPGFSAVGGLYVTAAQKYSRTVVSGRRPGGAAGSGGFVQAHRACPPIGGDGVIASMPVARATLALLFHVRHLATGRHFPIAADDAAAVQCGEPEQPDQTHSALVHRGYVPRRHPAAAPDSSVLFSKACTDQLASDRQRDYRCLERLPKAQRTSKCFPRDRGSDRLD